MAKESLPEKIELPEVKVTNTRWLILIIYVIYASLNTLQWVEYSIINNVVMKYYHVSASAVDWTSLTFSIMCPIMVIPASFIIDKKGLRVAGLIGSILTAIGAIIKIFSIGENRFFVVMIGQVVESVAQVFVLSLPPKIAITWFKSEEISRVCSLALFGLTLGSGVGFLVPPMMVPDSDNLDDIGYSLKLMCWTLAIATVPLALSVIYYFPAQPHYPPSQTMLEERQNRQEITIGAFMGSVKKLLTNRAFLTHMVCYGCIIGVFTAVGTLLNQIVLSKFPGDQEDAGRMGLATILSGMVGSLLTGVVLDKTRKFKETCFMIFLLCTICNGALAAALEMKSKLLVYIAITLFGLFLNAYLPAGIEFANELTFPSPESTVSGILIATSQIIGVILTIVLAMVMEKFGTLLCVLIMTGVLLFGTILTLLTPNNLLRQAAFNRHKVDELKPLKQ